MASESMKAIQRIEEILKANFKVEKLGCVANYLGIRVTKFKNSFLLDQEKYIWSIARKFELDKAKHCDIPLSPSYHSDPDDDKLPTNDKYRTAIGCLLYLSINTRPDIATAVAILSQKIAAPTTTDWKHVKNLIKYLKGTSSLRLKLGGDKEEKKLIGFADADWAEDRGSQKSNSGFIFILGGPISWCCKRQTCVALSSTEAEFIALSEACKESIWLQRILEDLYWTGHKTTIIHEDNQSVLRLIIDEKLSNRTKHIDTKIHFVKDYIDKGLVACEYCPTENMLADLFTKGLAKNRFITLRDRCSLISMD